MDHNESLERNDDRDPVNSFQWPRDVLNQKDSGRATESQDTKVAAFYFIFPPILGAQLRP